MIYPLSHRGLRSSCAGDGPILRFSSFFGESLVSRCSSEGLVRCEHLVKPRLAQHLGLTMYLTEARSSGVRGDQVVVRMKEVKPCTALLGRVLPRKHALGAPARSGSEGEPQTDAGTTPINHRVDSSHRADNRADSRSLRHRAYVPSATPISDDPLSQQTS